MSKKDVLLPVLGTEQFTISQGDGQVVFSVDSKATSHVRRQELANGSVIPFCHDSPPFHDQIKTLTQFILASHWL
jgi:hypothetical protein